METMWTILFGGLLLLSRGRFVNSESESEDLLQEILASLENDANEDFLGTPSTTATVDPLKLATVTSQKNFSNTTDNNQTVESRTDDNGLDRLLSPDNDNTSSASLSQSDDKPSDQALESLTTTPVSKYSSSSYDDVTAHPGLSFSSTTLNPTEQLCSTRNILQSLCREDLPSLVKIANIWDVYDVIFSDEVVNELLLNCPSGEWCLRDEFDIFRAKMAEKADMVLHSAVFADTCNQVSLGCLENVVRQLELCSFGERLNFTLEAVKLMCSLKDMTSTDLECTSQVLSALHITIMDILRKENEKQDLNPAFENDVCRSTEGLMTQTYLCTCSKCPENVIEALSSFRPWSWFIGDVEKLKGTCQFGNNTCVSRDTVFILDEAPPTTSTLSVPQADDTWFNQDSGMIDIRSSPVALVGIGTAVVIMTVGMTAFVILFVKRHRMTSRSLDYRPLETDDP